jgi:hypothetical protein
VLAGRAQSSRVDDAAFCREGLQGEELFVLHSLARAVKGRGLTTPSETRLLAAVILSIVAFIFLSTLINPPHWLHVAALFGHLIFLVIGFGSVIAVDWYGLLSLFGWTTIGDVLLVASRMTPMIWIGLAGLTLTGAFLQPQLNTWWVVVKLCCVLGVGIVGVLALSTSRALERQMPTPARPLVERGMVLAGASQMFWWTAVIIGFITNQLLH